MKALVVIVALLLAGRAEAQTLQPGWHPSPAEPDRQVGQHVFGLDALLGFYAGTGVGLRLGVARLGVHASATWNPVIATYKEPGDDADSIDGWSAYQLNLDAHAVLLQTTSRADIGVTAGYRHSSLLGHGLAGGFYAEFDPSRRVTYFLAVGLVVFPDGEDELRDRKDYTPGTEFGFPGPAINLVANVGMSFFP